MRALSIAILLALCASTHPVSAQYWSPPSSPDPTMLQDLSGASMTVMPDGTAWIVTGVFPQYSRWTADGWAPLAPVPPADGLNHRWPILGSAPDGTPWVLWEADRMYSMFYGMGSWWTGTGWSAPDTLWVKTTSSGTEYDLAPVRAGESWFVRTTGNPTFPIEAVHLQDGYRTSYLLPALGSLGAGRPRVALDPDGVVWVIWEEPTADPNSPRTYLVYTRFQNGAWDPPAAATEPSSFNRFSLVAASDNSKWIVSHEQDSRYGMLSNTLGRRWDGTRWQEPVMISDPIATSDTTQAQLSVSRGRGGNPVATWFRAALINPTRYDVVATQWNGSEWTRPVTVGRSWDAAFKEWPAGAAGSSGLWVSYRQAIPPNWNDAVFTTHSIPVPSLEGIAQLTVTARRPGPRLEWSVPKELGATLVRIDRAAGVYGPGSIVPPEGSTLVLEADGAHASKGIVTDRSDLSPGTYAYWLEVRSATDLLGWVGPRAVLIGGVAASRSLPPRVSAAGDGLLFRWTGVAAGVASISLYDAGGRRVRRIPLRPGADGVPFQAFWDGRTSGGSTAAKGIYFARVEGRGVPAAPATKVVWIR